jgi:UDP-N-acetylglucosamine--N-acetylmuramyl-(pentapeptide) pyrophosphoryl-undecaprenol N-acetylglucosamine transferase
MYSDLNSEDKSPIVVITGGGSGGHTVTATAVVDELIARFPDLSKDIVYLGGLKGMEGEKVGQSVESRVAQEKGIRFVGIRSGKLQRHVAISTVFGLFGVIGGIIDSIRFFQTHTVRFVFSTGGYVTVPVCFVAWMKHVPVVLHEQTTRVGLSNRLSALFSVKNLVGFEEAGRYFPKKKTIVVGNTLRQELTDESSWSRELISKVRRMKEQTPQYPTVLIAGGGQGSHLLNSIVLMALKSLVSNFNVIVMTGDNQVYHDYDRFVVATRKLSRDQQQRVLVLKYASASELGVFYKYVDAFVCRSGALFVYEAGALRIPSVFIPIPWVTQNEQYYNAKVLEELGLAKILPEGELSPEILFQEILRMVTRVRGGMLKVDDVHREKIFVKNAARRIVNELKPYIRPAGKLV